MKTALIIGAGPAGLTAAYFLQKQTDIHPIVVEQASFIGGISATRDYKNNKMDMGGHRFFSKSQKVMDWWEEILPLQGAPSKDDLILNRSVPLSDRPDAPDPEKEDKVMLQRQRFSRIYYLRRFFDYPVSLSLNTVLGLGPVKMTKICLSYAKVLLHKRPENSLEDFFINRFGKELYLTFFKDYTEKLWGIRCSEISAEWGAQRVKGISIRKILADMVRSVLGLKNNKNTETSLIDAFIYPKYGPGHLWQEVAERVQANGGEIVLNTQAVKVLSEGSHVTGVVVQHADGTRQTIQADYVLSTMPVKELIEKMGPSVPKNVQEVAAGLMYRDFRTVGLLLKGLKLKNKTKHKTVNNIIHDTWIYIQEKDVHLGRVQIFNNWSPYLVHDFENTVWIGLEYFCREGDDLWEMTDEDFIQLGIREAAQIGLIDAEAVLDACSFKVPKAYPAYFGTYASFDTVKNYVNEFDNLYLMGRNGMHRYNNMDHSVLTAMTVVDNIAHQVTDKENIWSINTEQAYHEEKQA